MRAGACGLKLHEDWGTTPAAIDACLRVADEYDIAASIHTDTSNEAAFVAETIAESAGRTINTYPTQGAGGGQARGKNRTGGRLTRVLVAEDKGVLAGAADTFRAAAAEQLATWGQRVGVPTVKSDVDGADPASVAYEAVKAGIDQEVDVVMIDTAGRLQNKTGLMDELGKVKRVIEKLAEVDEVLLVLDATTGQNGLNQARVFAEVVNITGIVLTKLDGTAKGGIVVAIQKSLGVPVKLIGLGEGADDLAPFEAESFVDALLN